VIIIKRTFQVSLYRACGPLACVALLLCVPFQIPILCGAEKKLNIRTTECKINSGALLNLYSSASYLPSNRASFLNRAAFLAEIAAFLHVPLIS
jgi:hypothetical protein